MKPPGVGYSDVVDKMMKRQTHVFLREFSRSQMILPPHGFAIAPSAGCGAQFAGAG
jgi:hypothetical protein